MRRAAVRAVVFDLGGVVVDWNPRHLYRKLIDDPAEVEHFLDEVDFTAWNLEQDRGRPFTEGVRLLSARFPHRAELIAAYHERWEESVPGVIQGTLELMEELRAAGLPLHALTNWAAETYELAERRFAFDRWFEQIVVSGREGVCKPEPAIFQLLLQRIGVAAPACLFIDDSPANVAGAAALGFQVHRFTGPQALRDELRERGLLDHSGNGTVLERRV
jgi:2-haloacid dehalogenase